MKLSREFWSRQVTWHVSTRDMVSHQRAHCEWMFCFAAGFLWHHCSHNEHTQQYLSGLQLLLTLWSSLFSPLCVCKRLCTLLTKPQCCIIYQPGERCCLHLISPPTCVLIVSANFALCRQVRCKCGWFEMHILTKENGREKGNRQSYASFVTVALMYFFYWKTIMNHIRLKVNQAFSSPCNQKAGSKLFYQLLSSTLTVHLWLFHTVLSLFLESWTGVWW